MAPNGITCTQVKLRVPDKGRGRTRHWTSGFHQPPKYKSRYLHRKSARRACTQGFRGALFLCPFNRCTCGGNTWKMPSPVPFLKASSNSNLGPCGTHSVQCGCQWHKLHAIKATNTRPRQKALQKKALPFRLPSAAQVQVQLPTNPHGGLAPKGSLVSCRSNTETPPLPSYKRVQTTIVARTVRDAYNWLQNGIKYTQLKLQTSDLDWGCSRLMPPTPAKSLVR